MFRSNERYTGISERRIPGETTTHLYDSLRLDKMGATAYSNKRALLSRLRDQRVHVLPQELYVFEAACAVRVDHQ